MRRGALRLGLAAILAAVASPSRAAWQLASSDHFLIYADADAAWLEKFARGLETFDAGLRALVHVPDEPGERSNRLTVYVVPSVGDVRRLCGRAPACAEIAGFYQGRASGSVAFTPRRAGAGSKFDLDADTILQHEYAHHFMFRNFVAPFPAWFVEGYAEFNSTARLDADGSIGFGLQATHRAAGLAFGRIPITLLLDPGTRRLTDQQTELLYGRGWLLTHYLTFDEARKGQLDAYLRAIGEGKPPLDAARAAFGDLQALDRDLDRYYAQRKMKYVRLAAGRFRIGAVTIRPLAPGEAAVMPVRLRSKRGVDDRSAGAVALDARRLAAPFPNDPAAQLALAEAEFDAGDDALAEAAADRALAADPQSVKALTYKGMIHLRRAIRAKSTDPAAWKEARSWVVRANRLDPDGAEPLVLFYESFDAAHAEPTASARRGLLRAQELAPEDDGLRFLTARRLLEDGDGKAARAMLASLAYSPHGGALGALAGRMIDRLAADGPKAALAEATAAEKAADAGPGDAPAAPK